MSWSRQFSRKITATLASRFCFSSIRNTDSGENNQ